MIVRLIKIALCFIISISFAQENTLVNNQKGTYLNLKVEGMHCAGGCAKFVENSLNRNTGISALVDFNNSKALIEYDQSLFSDQDIITMINSYQGGKFTASLLDNKNITTCSKGKQCCQKTGKLNPNCDNKNKGCCASKKCNKKNKKNKK